MINKINVKKSKLSLSFKFIIFTYNILFDFFYFISLKFI